MELTVADFSSRGADELITRLLRGKTAGELEKQTPRYLFIKSHSLRLSGEQLCDCWCVAAGRMTPLRSGWRLRSLSNHSQLGTWRVNISCRVSALSLSVDLLKDELKLLGYLFIFIFYFLKRKTLYRIYEKTHVDLYNLFKPGGMHILFVKITFLLWLIGITRGEWQGAFPPKYLSRFKHVLLTFVSSFNWLFWSFALVSIITNFLFKAHFSLLRQLLLHTHKDFSH